jgi:Flp pilus assembly protein TadG
MLSRSLGRRARRGSIAVIVGTSMIPLVGVMALGIDFARVAVVKAELQKAADAASLAAARYLESADRPHDAEVIADGRAYFSANLWLSDAFGFKLDGGSPKVEIIEPQRMQTLVSASGTVSMMFGDLLGIKESTVTVTSKTQRFVRGLEIVLALDTSASMRLNNRMKHLRSAAVDLVQILFGQTADFIPRLYDCKMVKSALGADTRQCSSLGFGLSVGVVPFAATVNVSPRAGSSGIVDTSQFNVKEWALAATTVAAKYSHNPLYGQRLDDPTPPQEPMAANYSTANWWKGCVAARRYPLESTQATTLPSTEPFKPYFYDSNSREFFPNSPEQKAKTGLDFTRASNYWPKQTTWEYYKTEQKDSFGNVVMGADGQPVMVDAYRFLTTAKVELWPQAYLDWSAIVPEPARFAFMNSNIRLIGGNRGTDNGPNRGCGSPILPLQPTRTAAINAILPLAPDAANGTAITLGMAWAWRLLDPEWESIWRSHRSFHWDLAEGRTFGFAAPRRTVENANYKTTTMNDAHMLVDAFYGASKDKQKWRMIQKYDATHSEKVVVLFTDGENEIGSGGDGIEGSSKETCCYSAYGRWWVDVKNDASLQPNPMAALNQQTKEICAAMKEKKIRIFVVQLHNNPSKDLQNTLNQNGCATDANHYFLVKDANLSDLRAKFREIARALTALRLMPTS